MQDNIPTLGEEIERKAFETIEKMHDDFKFSRITAEQFSYGIDILWSAVAGLAGRDFTVAMEMLGEMKTESARKVYLSRADGAIVRLIDNLAGQVKLTLIQPYKVPEDREFNLTEAPMPLAAARSKILTLTRSFIERGFTEI